VPRHIPGREGEEPGTFFGYRRDVLPRKFLERFNIQ
jgi:hypothetical protein